MKIISLDPRVTRFDIPKEKSFDEAKDLDQWPTYEVFHQTKRGQHHQHVGCVHAPNAEMAMLYAKEIYSRRGFCVNLWVVKSADISASDYDDTDIFETVELKEYRDPASYKVMNKIKEFKERQ